MLNFGFGSRIEEGTLFYHRYPHWSKMGKMVADARGAVEAMINLDFIDGNKVYVTGNEELIPVDFLEVLASIAPRPLLVFSPVYDKDAYLHDVKLSVEPARKIYNLYGDTENIILNESEDYNRFSSGMREKLYEWLREQL